MSEEADSLSDQASDLEAEYYAERYGGYSECEITASKAVHKSKPLPCALPDPEDAYTVEQVRECLVEMEAQLASYPVNLSRGPGWVRQQILSMLDRGIVADQPCEKCASGYCCPLQRVTEQRDELLSQVRASLEFMLTKTRKPGDWCFKWIVEPIEPCPCIICNARALLSRIESEQL